MPFQSEKQRRFLHANHPEIAKRWESEYATGGISNHFRKRIGLKKGSSSDGPGPGGQGARGQATQNPGSSGGPPGGGSGGQGGAMHYQAPTPTYQNVHQTGAISQTPGQTITTTGDGKTGDHHPPIRPKKTYGPYTPKNKYLPHYPALSKWQKEKVKDIITRAKKGTHGGYGPYTDKYTKLQHQPSLSNWQKKEFKDWETLVKKGAHGGYGPYTPPVDLGLVEELSTKDYTSSEPYWSDETGTGQWYDAGGNPIDNPNINPELAGMIKPIVLSETQTKDLKPSKMFSTSDMKVAYEKAQNMNAKQFKAWAKKEGQTGEYIDKLSSALDYNETSVGKVDMIGKNATKMLDLPGLGDDKQELKNAAGTLMGMVESSANKYDWNEKSDVKLSLANDFYKDKEKYKNLGINKVTDLDEFIDVVYTSVTKSQGIAEGGVARKNYFHGGILDINESEEIISDDGNDIELTDYNAAFDDPKDLSTGVKTLFQAKDGGRIGYAQGWSPGVAAEERAAEKSSGGGQYHGGGADVMAVQSVGHPTGDAEVASQIAADDRQRKQELKDLVATGPGSAEEKYSDYSAEDAGDLGGYTETKRNQLYSARTRTELAEAKRIQLAKIKKMGKAKLIPAVLMFIASGGNISLAMKTFTMSKKDMIDVVRHSLPVMKAKKEHLKALDEYKTALLGQVDILNPNEMKSKIGTNISDITNEINDLTKTPEDDTKGDGPEPPVVVPIGEEIEAYAQGPHRMSAWEQIKANQAKKAMLVDKGIHTEYNPIVDESVTDITMEANRGGLANLFRVKNQ